ncbi:MAG TPA: hypothetical protein VIM08_14920, partial [Arthrobacter sp.]
ALVLGFGSVPAVAFSAPASPESPTAGSGGASAAPLSGTEGSDSGVQAGGGAGGAPSPGVVAAGPTDAGLAEAVRQDLGMTLAEFNAAGALGRRAADAADSLRELPGFVGISLKDGKILVEGAGTALQATVDELNQSGPADFVLVAPPVPGAATPAAATPAPASR